MKRDFTEGAIVIAPLFVGFAVHGLCIRAGVLNWLARPISNLQFGANKTYRGLVCVAAGTALGFAAIRPLPLQTLQSSQLLGLGFLTGAVAMAAELPNSFLKRRLDIAPGAHATGSRGLVFHLLDQIDVVFGAWTVLAWVLSPNIGRVIGSFAMMYAGHQMVSVAGYWLGMRKTAR